MAATLSIVKSPRTLFTPSISNQEVPKLQIDRSGQLDLEIRQAVTVYIRLHDCDPAGLLVAQLARGIRKSRVANEDEALFEALRDVRVKARDLDAVLARHEV